MRGSLGWGQRSCSRGRVGGDMGKQEHSQHIKEQQPVHRGICTDIPKQGAQPGEALLQSSFSETSLQNLFCSKAAWQLQSKLHKQVIRKCFHFIINISQLFLGDCLAWAAILHEMQVRAVTPGSFSHSEETPLLYFPSISVTSMQQEWCLHKQ